jgi:addiction module HigA family antidote
MARITKRERRLVRPPTHPGAILREDVLPALRLSVSDVARQLGISRQMLHRVLACRAPVTPDMAVRLGKFCGNGPGLWLRLQQAFELWHVERRLAEEIANIPTHGEATVRAASQGRYQSVPAESEVFPSDL